MTNPNTAQQQILSVDNSYWAELVPVLNRLMDNQDFQKLILSAYFEDKALRQVGLLANMQTIKRGERPQVMEELIAISHLQDFFLTIQLLGTTTESIFDTAEEKEEG